MHVLPSIRAWKSGVGIARSGGTARRAAEALVALCVLGGPAESADPVTLIFEKDGLEVLVQLGEASEAENQRWLKSVTNGKTQEELTLDGENDLVKPHWTRVADDTTVNGYRVTENQVSCRLFCVGLTFYPLLNRPYRGNADMVYPAVTAFGTSRKAKPGQWDVEKGDIAVWYSTEDRKSAKHVAIVVDFNKLTNEPIVISKDGPERIYRGEAKSFPSRRGVKVAYFGFPWKEITVRRQQSGKLKIDERRDPAWPPWATNRIEIDSQVYRSFNKSRPEQGVRFVLERSLSPVGPFTPGPIHHVWPDMAPQGLGYEALPGRQFVIYDRIYKAFADGKAQYGPVYYRVAQTDLLGSPVDRTRFKEVGVTVYSNVVGPGASAIRLAGELRHDAPPTNPLAPLRIATANDPWLTLEATMEIEDQAYEHRDVHFTVTSGSFTGHFFVPAYERPIGDKLGTTRLGTTIKVPVTPGAATVSIVGVSPNGCASGTFPVPLEPSSAAAVQATLQVRPQQWAVVLKSKDELIARSQSDVDWCDKRRREKQKESGSDSWEYKKECWGYVEAKVRWLRQTRVEKPEAELRVHEAAAEAARDWKQLLEIRRKIVALALTARKIDEQRLAAGEKVISGSVPASDPSGVSWRDSVKASLANLKEQLEGSPYRDEPLRQMAIAALLSADRTGYLFARREQLRGSAYTANPENRAGLLREMSDDLVMLTGDRNLGVRLRHMSWDAILSKYEGEQRLRVLHQIEDAPKPDWWPIGAQSYALGKTIRNEDLPQWDTGDEAMRGGPPAEGISVLPDPAESSDLDASQRQGSGKTGASAGPSRPGGAKSNGPTGVVEDLSGTMPRQPGKTPAQGRSGDDLFFRMPVNRAWSPTGFRLRQGTKIIILAGEHAEAAAPADPRATHHRVRPEGVAGKLPRLPYPHLPALSLVGRIGNGPVFAVGGGLQMPVTPEQDGKELSLGINDDNVADNAGHWGIRIAILP